MRDAVELGPGAIVAGKYRIERVLGRGGMGVVFEALHLELDQRVAMKLLLPEATKNAEAVERFVREGRASAKLSTPHVAKVYDVGRLETGQPFLVMEFLRGRDLKALVEERGPQSLPDVARWVMEAAEALAEAHALGVVHRDIKPANLFLAELPTGRTTIKVVDFGISKQLDTGAVDLTRTSSMMGSPLYMAPEQVMSMKHVDPRVDIWALGVVLYELATGHTPFNGSALTEVIGQIMTREPALPSAVRPDLPQAFDHVVMTCLRKDPQHRYPTMGSLDQALRDMLSGATTGPAMQTRPALQAVQAAQAMPTGQASHPRLADLFEDELGPQPAAGQARGSVVDAGLAEPLQHLTPSAPLPADASTAERWTTEARTSVGYPSAPVDARASSAKGGGAEVTVPPAPFRPAFEAVHHEPAASLPSAGVTQQGWGATGNRPSVAGGPSKAPLIVATSLGGLVVMVGIGVFALRGMPTAPATSAAASPDASAVVVRPTAVAPSGTPSVEVAPDGGTTVDLMALPDGASSAKGAAASTPSANNAPKAAPGPAKPGAPARSGAPSSRPTQPSTAASGPPPASTPKKPSMY